MTVAKVADERRCANVVDEACKYVVLHRRHRDRLINTSHVLCVGGVLARRTPELTSIERVEHESNWLRELLDSAMLIFVFRDQQVRNLHEQNCRLALFFDLGAVSRENLTFRSVQRPHELLHRQRHRFLGDAVEQSDQVQKRIRCLGGWEDTPRKRAGLPYARPQGSRRRPRDFSRHRFGSSPEDVMVAPGRKTKMGKGSADEGAG